MNAQKYKNMISTYAGFKGPQTVAAVLSQIPEELQKKLSGKELGAVMTAINNAYHNGKGSMGAEVYDASPTDGAVFIDCLNTSIEWTKQGEKIILKFAE